MNSQKDAPQAAEQRPGAGRIEVCKRIIAFFGGIGNQNDEKTVVFASFVSVCAAVSVILAGWPR